MIKPQSRGCQQSGKDMPACWSQSVNPSVSFHGATQTNLRIPEIYISSWFLPLEGRTVLAGIVGGISYNLQLWNLWIRTQISCQQFSSFTFSNFIAEVFSTKDNLRCVLVYYYLTTKGRYVTAGGCWVVFLFICWMTQNNDKRQQILPRKVFIIIIFFFKR